MKCLSALILNVWKNDGGRKRLRARGRPVVAKRYLDVGRRKPLPVLVAVLFFAMPAFAGESGPGQISDLQVDGDTVVFAVSGPTVNKPPCAIWTRYVFSVISASGQAKLAYLLSAQATQKLVKVYGAGDCAVASEHETAGSVRDG